MAGKISTYIDDVRTEIKKVNWLSKDELMGSTVIVVVFSIILASFLFVADYSISELISWFLRS